MPVGKRPYYRLVPRQSLGMEDGGCSSPSRAKEDKVVVRAGQYRCACGLQWVGLAAAEQFDQGLYPACRSCRSNDSVILLEQYMNMNLFLESLARFMGWS
jgi:hypothetical protein